MGLFYRIYIGIALVLLSVISIFIYTAVRQEDKLVTRALDNNQLILASSVSTQLEIGYFERIWPFELLNEISKDENFLFWHIINGEQDIELSSKSVGDLSKAEVDFFKTNKNLPEKTNLDFIDQDSKVWLVPLKIKSTINQNEWIFCLGYSTKNLRALFWNNFLIYLYVTVALIALTVPITTHLTRQALRPLIILADATTKIRKGNFDVSLPTSRTKEVRQLIIAYEAMLGGLRRKDKKIHEQINQLNAAFSELEELNRTLERRVVERTEKLSYTNNQLKKLSKRLSIEKEKAETANKSISAFMANMSHEIRTPLNAILGFAQVIERREKDDKKRNMVNNITLAGETLLALINDILDLSKIEANQLSLSMDSFDLKKLIEEVFILFSGNAKARSIDYQLNYPPDFNKLIVSDPVRLKQIMINLIGNAFKFTEQGHVHVNVIVEHNNDTNTADISIDVVDSGLGIPEDQQKRIFDAFVQKEDQSVQKYGGTGLGLAISLRLAHLMNGNLYIKESTLNRGSTFTLWLDNIEITNNIGIDGEFKQDIGKLTFTTPITILYIDDIELNCVIFREFLAEGFTNYQLIECQDGQHGLEKLVEEKIDITFVDLKMPPPTGVEVTRQIRSMESIKELPVIALTASTERTEHENFFKAGGDKLLLKPLQFHDIITVLQEYFEVNQ